MLSRVAHVVSLLNSPRHSRAGDDQPRLLGGVPSRAAFMEQVHLAMANKNSYKCRVAALAAHFDMAHSSVRRYCTRQGPLTRVPPALLEHLGGGIFSHPRAAHQVPPVSGKLSTFNRG